jgi:hypothetical protein
MAGTDHMRPALRKQNVSKTVERLVWNAEIAAAQLLEGHGETWVLKSISLNSDGDDGEVFLERVPSDDSL